MRRMENGRVKAFGENDFVLQVTAIPPGQNHLRYHRKSGGD